MKIRKLKHASKIHKLMEDAIIKNEKLAWNMHNETVVSQISDAVDKGQCKTEIDFGEYVPGEARKVMEDLLLYDLERVLKKKGYDTCLFCHDLNVHLRISWEN